MNASPGPGGATLYLWALFHFILMTSLGGGLYYPHFTDKEPEATQLGKQDQNPPGSQALHCTAVHSPQSQPALLMPADPQLLLPKQPCLGPEQLNPSPHPTQGGQN